MVSRWGYAANKVIQVIAQTSSVWFIIYSNQDNVDNDDDDDNDDCIADGDDDMRRERVREFLPEFFERSLLCKYPTILNQTQQYSTISNNSQHDFF